MPQLVPPVLRRFWHRLTTQDEPRFITKSAVGIEAYIKPDAHLGRTLIASGRYEPETEDIFAREIKPGSVVLDIGANEGYFSAYAGHLAGPTGMVVCVEPQSRLQSIIRINLAINGVARWKIYHAAFGEDEGKEATINLFPEDNTGQSGLLHKPRFGWTTLSNKTEPVKFVSPERIMKECAIERFDFCKVDVEGFEFKVVDALLPTIRAGRLKTLLLDYHHKVLAEFNISPDAIHAKLLDAGMKPESTPTPTHDGYVLYRHEGQR